MKSAKPHTQHGLTLLEVLVALTVLSIGLLGIAALQTQGLRAHHSAHLRTQASLMAQDMLDRLRANPLGQQHYHGFDSQAYDLPSPGCINNGCEPQQLAEHDLHHWQQQFVRHPAPALPDGRGVIEHTNGITRIVVLWREATFSDLAKRQCINDQAADIACISMSVRL